MTTATVTITPAIRKLRTQEAVLLKLLVETNARIETLDERSGAYQSACTFANSLEARAIEVANKRRARGDTAVCTTGWIGAAQ